MLQYGHLTFFLILSVLIRALYIINSETTYIWLTFVPYFSRCFSISSTAFIGLRFNRYVAVIKHYCSHRYLGNFASYNTVTFFLSGFYLPFRPLRSVAVCNADYILHTKFDQVCTCIFSFPIAAKILKVFFETILTAIHVFSNFFKGLGLRFHRVNYWKMRKVIYEA